MRFIDDLRGDDARAWFLQVVRNAAFTCLRRHRAAELVAIDDGDAAVEERATAAADEPYAALARKHDGARLDRAIASLPTGYREVFVLREMEAFSYAEIARIADVPVGTVMSRLSRARARLRVALGDADRPMLRPVQAPVRSGGRGMTKPMELDDHLRAHAFVDDELDLESRVAFEARLADDPVLRRRVDELKRLRQAVREEATYHAAPDDLRAALLATTPVAAARVPGGSPRFRRHALALAASVAVVTVATVLVVAPMRSDGALRDQVVASHVRSTLGAHLVDIASSDRHVVKPWLSQRLDYSPPVGDADVGGATFVGGRIDYLDERPVAALVYRQGAHVAEVFVWPGARGDRSPSIATARGFHVAHWSRHGMEWWAISDASPDAFGTFVDALERAPL